MDCRHCLSWVDWVGWVGSQANSRAGALEFHKDLRHRHNAVACRHILPTSPCGGAGASGCPTPAARKNPLRPREEARLSSLTVRTPSNISCSRAGVPTDLTVLHQKCAPFQTSHASLCLGQRGLERGAHGLDRTRCVHPHLSVGP